MAIKLEDSQKILKIINDILYEEAGKTVGVLCGQIEVMVKAEKFDPELYKELAKEVVYERTRVIKRIIDANFMPKITFDSKE